MAVILTLPDPVESASTLMRKRISPQELQDLDARRICIIKPSAMGDVVQTLPVLSALRERFRRATIAWVVNSELQELLSLHPALDEIIRFERRGSWAGWMKLLGELRLRQFDLVFDLQGLLRTGVMTRVTGAAIRVGLQTAREGAHLACNCTLPDTGKHVPAHSRYWRVAEAVGMGDLRPQTTIVVPDGDRRWARRKLQVLPGPVLAVHPGARWVTKRYPIEKLAAVASRAVREFGFSIVLVGGRGEISGGARLEQFLHRRLPAETVLNLVGQTSLKRLTAVLGDSVCLLSTDSGPMHLAAGLRVPVVGIFTCTSPVRSGPPGNQHELVATTVPCAASYKKRCPHAGPGHLACLQELTAERVWHALARAVDKNRLAERAA